MTKPTRTTISPRARVFQNLSPMLNISFDLHESGQDYVLILLLPSEQGNPRIPPGFK